jgi:hypothetical protein
MRFGALTTIFSILELLLPIYADAFPRGIFAALSVFTAIGGMVARVVAQKEFHNGSAT